LNLYSNSAHPVRKPKKYRKSTFCLFLGTGNPHCYQLLLDLNIFKHNLSLNFVILDTSNNKTNNFFAINNSSTTNDDQQNTIFNGRGGTSGRSRGSSFGNNAGLNFKVFILKKN